MDRRTILAVVLSILVYYGWLLARGPVPPPEGAELEAAADAVEAEVSDEAPAPPPAPVPVARSEHPERTGTFEACGARGAWTSDGGIMRDMVLLDYSEPYIVTPIYTWLLGKITGSIEGPWVPYGGHAGPARVLSEDARALAVGSGADRGRTVSMEILEEEEARVAMRGRTEDGLVVEQRIERRADPCVLSVDVTWRNSGTAPYQGDVWVGIHDTIPDAPGGMLGRYQVVARPMVHSEGGLEYGDPAEMREDGPQEMPGPITWFGLADRYFGFLIVPDADDGLFAFDALDAERAGGTWRRPVELAAGAAQTEHFQVYIGPLDLDLLRPVSEPLTDAVYFGWFAFFAYPLLWLLELFQAGVHNWGIAIVFLTLLVKVVFFPLTQTAFKSGQAMSALQPELQKIKEEFKDNQEELNKRTMELFKEHGVNPLGGCLPMLIQFPVWIALYNVLLNSVELYQTEFLYLRDLTVIDPYCIGPAIVVVLMLVQQQFTPTGNMDPAQARMMKLMPLFFGFFFFTFPGGLVVYIFMNMLLSIAQQWLIRRTYKAPGASTAPA